MIRTLYGKLAVLLLSLLTLAGLFYVVLAMLTSRAYVQEVNQRLNRTLAEQIVAHEELMVGSTVNESALKGLFDSLMVINPSIEVYLVDRDGRILAFSAPPGQVVRERISMQPVRAFLDGVPALPILGDDPRDGAGRKVFSAAPIPGTDGAEGYLYVVLGGTAYETVAEMFQASYILRLGVGVAIAGLLVTLVIGVISFNWLTRRLRRLTGAVEHFQRSDFQVAPRMAEPTRRAGGDEIDQLGQAFGQMSERIRLQIDELEQGDAARRELVANISHDLRTPMAALQGYLETLQIKDGVLSEAERRQYLGLAIEHGERLGRLIDELFELARLENRDTDLSFEPFSLAELVQDVSQKYVLAAEQRALRLETAIPSDAPYVSGDIGLIERVLENLIENALKYTPEGGSIQLSLIPGAGQVSAQVRDSGGGIPEIELPHIFERSYRIARHDAEAPDGAGLGLAIARRIVQLHGGTIGVESKPGNGTAFTFSLPLVSAG